MGNVFLYPMNTALDWP